MSKIIRRLVIGAAALALLAPAAATAPAEAAAPFNTKIATYNTKPHWKNGEGRMRQSLAFMKQQGIVVAATQEYGDAAAAAVKASPDWHQFRATPNGGKLGSGNAVIWRAGNWKKVKAVEYKFLFQDAKLGPRYLHFPVVKLQNTRNKHMITVVSLHQPAGAKYQTERNRLRALHAKRIAQLKKNNQHIIVMGDFNENQPISCRWTRHDFLLDASGYRDSDAAGCDAMPPRQQSIDRIFGQDKIRFSHYAKLSKPKDADWSDHKMIATQVRYW